MHELSIACSIVDSIEENLPDSTSRATKVNLRIGALSGVDRDALEFSFDIATDGTRAAGARLDIEELPVIVRCVKCEVDTKLGNPPVFRCEKCGESTANIIQGKELEIVSIEVEDGKSANC